MYTKNTKLTREITVYVTRLSNSIYPAPACVHYKDLRSEREREGENKIALPVFFLIFFKTKKKHIITNKQYIFEHKPLS